MKTGREERGRMVGLELAREFIEAVVMSGYVVEDPPVSAMLIAAPESGKSSLITRIAPGVPILADATGNGICELLDRETEARHLAINDLSMLTAHKEAVNKRTFGILAQLTDEGLHRVAMANSYRDYGGRRVGVIACVPEGIAGDKRNWWLKTGFSTRFLPFFYGYSASLEVKIKESVIISGLYERKKDSGGRNGTHSQLTPKRVQERSVKLSAKFGNQIQLIADAVARRLWKYERGIRRGFQLRALARGHALARHSGRVERLDIDFLFHIAPFINFSGAVNIDLDSRVLNGMAEGILNASMRGNPARAMKVLEGEE